MRASAPNTKRELEAGMRNAANYEAWREAALAHDALTGADLWREQERTRLYDYGAIRFRLDRLRRFRASGDYHGILYALDEGVHGNMARMGNRELYNRAASGTKKLIEEYIEEVCLSLRELANCNDPKLGHQDRVDFFRRAALCYGRPALLLSGGGVFGNFHLGVIRALLQQKLLPNVISGSSAGSLIAAVVGTHRRRELLELLDAEHFLIRSSKAEEWRLADAIFPRFEHADVLEHIERLVPDLTFAEAYQKTGLYINISVSPSQQHQTSRLLNAITAPRVCIRSAVLASSSVPGIYPPAQLYAKGRNGKRHIYLADRKWVDGSVSDDLPAQRLSRLYGVNFYIVSMVNPIALMTQPVQQPHNWRQDLWQFWHHSAKNAARTMQNLSQKMSNRWPDLNYNINSAMSILMQDYSGDVNILPPAGMVKLWRGMRQPTVSYMQELIDAGERSTWPKIERIRNSTRIAMVLEEILEELDPSGVGPFRHVAEYSHVGDDIDFAIP